MTYKEYVQSKTKTELQQELKELNCVIDDCDCFGVRDLVLREEIEKELDRREYEDE